MALMWRQTAATTVLLPCRQVQVQVRRAQLWVGAAASSLSTSLGCGKASTMMAAQLALVIVDVID